MVVLKEDFMDNMELWQYPEEDTNATSKFHCNLSVKSLQWQPQMLLRR